MLGIVAFFGLYLAIKFFLLHYKEPEPYFFLILIGGTPFFIFSVLFTFYWMSVPLPELKMSIAAYAIPIHLSLWFGLCGKEVLPINEIDLRIGLLIWGVSLFNFLVIPLFLILAKRALKLELAEELGKTILTQNTDTTLDQNRTVYLRTGLSFLKTLPKKDVRQWLKESLRSPEKTWEIFKRIFSDK
jgi:hypothetical protein